MVSGDQNETRALFRLPNLEIAMVHRGVRGGEGEQVMSALRTVPSMESIGSVIESAAPLVFWMQLTQAAWTSWFGCLAAAAPPPWIRRGE